MKRSKLLTIPRAATRMLLATLLLTMTAQTAWATIGGTGTQSDPYTINSVDDWNTFASNVNNGSESYSGKTVKLTADIGTAQDPITATVGTVSGSTQGNAFAGIFDGSGHTIHVNITNTSDQGTALFRYISGATIKNVKVTGTVNGTMHCAGLVGFAASSTTCAIKNCEVATSVTCGGNNHSHCGGILGHGLSSTTTISNCLFSGSISGTTSATGIIYGWGDDGTHSIVNCLSAGNYSGCSGVELLKKDKGTESITNCYRKTNGGSQGTDASSMTANELAVALNNGGEEWQVVGDYVVPIMVQNPYNILYATITDVNSRYLYTGSAISIAPTVTAADGTVLTENTHYTVTIKNSSNETVTNVINEGDYTLTVTAKDGSSYIGSQIFSFSVSDCPEGLSIDTDYSKGQDGYYYVNMPKTGTTTVTLPDGFTSSFNVYDCGGKNHDQDLYNLNEELVITAPLGYAVKITGTAKTDDGLYSGSEYLSVYDGTSTSGTLLGRFGTTSHPERYNVNVQSSSNSIMLKFRSYIYSIKGRGLNLTVSLVEVPYFISYATINIEKYHRYTGSAVDLGYTVDDSKGNRLTQGTHYNAIIKDNNGSVVESAISEGHYTLTIEGISPYSGSKTVDFWVNEIPGLLIDSDIAEGTLGHFFSLMPKSGSATVDLTQSDVATFMIYDDGGKGGGYDGYTPGNFTPKANGYLLLHAPAGFQIHLNGYVRTKSSAAYLTVHDGNTESAPTLCANVHGVNSSAGSSSYKDVTVDVISTGEYMLLHFDAGTEAWGWDSEGLVLTASIGHSITVADGITHGSVSCDNFWIKGSSTTIPLTVTPDVGYSVNTVSYNDGSNHTLTPDVNGDYSFTMPDKPVLVSATFTPTVYNISYELTDGTVATNNPDNYTIESESFTLINPTRTGYEFTGWTGTGLDAASTNVTIVQGTTGNRSYTATWTPISYTICYNGVEGATFETPNPATYTIESDAITLNNPTKDSYTFAGWYDNVDYSGDAITTIAAGSTGDKTFYAKWTLVTYDITYNGVEGATNPNPAGYTIESEAITLDAPTKDGYTFAGWFDNAEFIGSAVTTITAGSTGDKTFWAKWIQDMTYGGVTIKDNGTTKSATLDASQEDAVSITSDVVVNAVELNRDFTANQPATVMLPFSLADGQTVSGGSFYKFSGVTKDGDEWKAQFTEVATLKANTPYLFNPSATGQMTFNLNGGTVTLNTTTTGDAGNTTTNWEFHGTYQKVMWNGNTGGNTDPSDLDKTYGFAKGNGTTIAAGQFVHFTAGAWLKPMRCYLVYNGSTEGGTFQNARRMTRGAASTEELPQTITVVLMSSSGETTGIGTLDTKAGDITLDGWYTMDGRKLEGKPTKKGLYINNGRKIVIK